MAELKDFTFTTTGIPLLLKSTDKVNREVSEDDEYGLRFTLKPSPHKVVGSGRLFTPEIENTPRIVHDKLEYLTEAPKMISKLKPPICDFKKSESQSKFKINLLTKGLETVPQVQPLLTTKSFQTLCSFDLHSTARLTSLTQSCKSANKMQLAASQS